MSKSVYEAIRCLSNQLAEPKYDYEKLVLCDAIGNKVLVESYTDISDPTQVRTTRYTDLVTNLPYTGAAEDLTVCGGEQIDIQTKQYCDGGETVFGTLVFDASLSTGTPTLLGIVFHKVNGSIHTPVNPTEGACDDCILFDSLGTIQARSIIR